MTGNPPATSPGTTPRLAEPGAPVTPVPSAPAPLERISSAELAELRRRADRHRFLFKTVVTVTSLLVVSLLIVALVAILFDN